MVDNKILCYTIFNMKQLFSNQQGLGLSAMIALGFAAAVVLVFIIGIIVYAVNS